MEMGGDSQKVLLSPRQLEVVKLMAEDLTSKQIAVRLGISTKTAKYHRYQIKRRLGVKGTGGIVRWAIRNAVIEA